MVYSDFRDAGRDILATPCWVNFCQNDVSRKICSAPSPLPVYSSSCHCICIKKKNLNMKCILIWQICKNMHPHRAPLCWWCQSALQLQVDMGLTLMAVTPSLLLPFCSGTLYGRGYGGWFSPSTGRRSGQYVHPVRVAPVPARSGPQLTNQGYPGLSQFIWLYPWLTVSPWPLM